MIEVYSLMRKEGDEVWAITENLADMAEAITEAEQEYVRDNMGEQWFGSAQKVQEVLDTLEEETAMLEAYMTRKLKRDRYSPGNRNLVEGLDFYAGEYVVQAFTLYNSRPEYHG